ncbi:hypothetical protein E0K89_017910 [Aquicoccus sp. SCR17]|nr:hypothetical protein [Carideicomes alvinocaridis]
MTIFTKTQWTRRALFAASAVLVAGFGAVGEARANWPEGNLRVIVPYGPGGSSDNVTRAITPALEEILDTNITVENIGGGGGVIGVTRLANSKPDGATFGVVPTATLAIAPHMRQLNYDPIEDIQAVAKVAEGYFALAMRPDFPADTLQGVIDYAKENPGQLTLGSAGVGGITHLVVEVFAKEADIEVQHVPFKGSNEAMNNVMGGHVDGQFDAVMLRQAQSGAVKPIVMLNDQRWDGLPDTPTAKEEGFDGFGTLASWWGVIAPAGTPQEAVDAMSAAVEEALQRPDVQKRLESLGLYGTYLDAGAFGDQIAENYQTYGEILEPLGLSQ